ncbi:hypothetical protein ACI2L1_04230 [Streptomyces sp. NPDC019531]|uniref:hypothetical protein n=1 Tax=Streptomyces sp. NPDC019531 TaxID=3365062 RepID=UPI00384EE8F2
MGVGIARVSRIEHGEVATPDVIARYVEALGSRLDLVADFGDHTPRMPASGDQGSAAAWLARRPWAGVMRRTVRQRSYGNGGLRAFLV